MQRTTLVALFLSAALAMGCSGKSQPERSKPASGDDAAATSSGPGTTPRASKAVEVVTGKARQKRIGKLTLLLDRVPAAIKAGSYDNDGFSNIRAQDYVGPEKCRECHEKKYASWRGHAHSIMNQLADEKSIQGDFSGVSIQYKGGTVRFYKEGSKFRMSLTRAPIKRVYAVNQTIGSRFTQYYVGKLLSGPEAKGHKFYTNDHVLPLGWWKSEKMWIPIVNTREKEYDTQKEDPYSKPGWSDYAGNCSQCHTTRPFGDWLLRQLDVAAFVTPRPFAMLVGAFLQDAHPTLVPPGDLANVPTNVITQAAHKLNRLDATERGAVLGISCEACHNGGAEHAADEKTVPRFFPSSPYLFISKQAGDVNFGRSAENFNWICGRCHTGQRPLYAGGMATWNSTEHTDATRGSCYSKLTCVTCHNPHSGIGPKWRKTPARDNEICLECHEKYQPAAARKKHTGHKAGSSGDDCMNCHMPKINEGMENMVRTHVIFSPTNTKMIQANQPNACNLCHTRKPIDWTLGYLKKWYGASYDEAALAKAYPTRAGPTAIGWLRGSHEGTQLSALEALGAARSKWALPELIAALDHRKLIHRQFAQRRLEAWLGIRLRSFGYVFYMTPSERKGPLAKIRSKYGQRNK